MEIGAISVLLKNKMWDSVINVLKGIKPEVCPETCECYSIQLLFVAGIS